MATLLPGTDATRVQTLVDLALQNDGFAPDITDDNPNNDEIGLLLDLWKDSNNNGVRDANEVVQQPLIVMVKSAALGDRVWHDVNADGIQNVGGDGAYTEQGIAGAVVRLVRDRDGDGDFTSAGEVLATTTTDADGNYVFKGLAPGLDYQVQFFTPTGFDAASPRQQGASRAPATRPTATARSPTSSCSRPANGTRRSTPASTSRSRSATSSGTTRTPTASRTSVRPGSAASA